MKVSLDSGAMIRAVNWTFGKLKLREIQETKNARVSQRFQEIGIHDNEASAPQSWSL